MENVNIASAQYENDVLTGDKNVIIRATIDGVETFVPLDPANTHYAEIMRQVEAGTLTTEDAE